MEPPPCSPSERTLRKDPFAAVEVSGTKVICTFRHFSHYFSVSFSCSLPRALTAISLYILTYEHEAIFVWKMLNSTLFALLGCGYVTKYFARRDKGEVLAGDLKFLRGNQV